MSNVRLPSAADRHLLNRCTFGVTPALVAGAKAAGGGPAWLNRQLHPESIRDSAATRMATWFPVLSKSPQVQWQDARDGRATVYDMGVDFGNWTMLRRTYSRRQLHEVMVSFWSDLLHIPVSETKSWPLRISYDRSIRKHALGRFDNLLVATETHPAMGAYLDNATSTRTKLNENLGREVLELHTVGVGGGYSESDVLDSARILTGYRVDLGTTWRGRYSTVDHHVGAVKVIGFTSANASADGRKVAEAYLRYLAHHPLTAQRVAARLCTRFGSDEPSAGYVNRVAKVYSQSGTDIKATLKAVLSDRAFQSSIGAKVRTPAEDIVATIRALGVTPARPTRDSDLANVLFLQAAFLGQRPFGWPRPDGPPDVGDAWASASRMLASWYVHYGAAEGWTPSTGCTYQKPTTWLPPLPASTGDVIQHASKLLLCRRVGDVTIGAVAKRMALTPRTRVGRTDLSDWRIGLMLAALLDTPTHMMR